MKSLRFTAAYIGGQKDRVRTALLFLTDGASTTPVTDEDSLYKGLGIPIYTVGLHAGGPKEYDPALLQRLSRSTGGAFSDGRAPELVSLYRRALGDLASRREALSLAPPPSGCSRGAC